MRKITLEIVTAFEGRYAKTQGNTHTDGTTLYLHGNAIAQWRDGELWVTSAGWETVTTKERLNGIDGVHVTQKDYQWYLNGKEWNGEWVNVQEFTAPQQACSGCGKELEHPRVALSRYGHGDLCPDCGVGEALLGDFITKRTHGVYA